MNAQLNTRYLVTYVSSTGRVRSSQKTNVEDAVSWARKFRSDEIAKIWEDEAGSRHTERVVF